MNEFKPSALPALIGSLPLENHKEATQLVFDYCPEIPLWVQLPRYPNEGMISQFLSGMPGVVTENDKPFVDTTIDGFDEAVLQFYEDYSMVTEGGAEIEGSRFEITPESAQGIYELLAHVQKKTSRPLALKGQITGPITFATETLDREGRAIFYDDQLRDIAIKLLALKAGWQAKKLSETGHQAIVFFDEPALVHFGASRFLTITKEDVISAIQELTDAVHAHGALAGVHVCANTKWDILLDSNIDIISFDAYSFFDTFILSADKIKVFIERGGIIASGIIPTSPKEDIDRETPESLAQKWETQAEQLEALGLEKQQIREQTLITPSCGTGSLPLKYANTVLSLTKDVSAIIREG